MGKWLYSTQGKPIAFVKEEEVFTCDGRRIGKLEGKKVTNKGYIGEIVRDYYFVRNIQELQGQRPPTENLQHESIKEVAGCMPPVSLPWGYTDLRF